MGTVLFTDYGILVFAMTTGAIALILMLAVLDLQQRIGRALTSSTSGCRLDSAPTL